MKLGLLLFLLIPFDGEVVESNVAGLKTTESLKPQRSLDDSITLEIQFGEKRSKKIEGIPFKKEMTILDVMNYAKEKEKLSFSYRGKKDTAFLTQIDDVKNKGSRGDNWIFRVNGKLGRKSFGVSELNKGDKVTWTFGKYKP